VLIERCQYPHGFSPSYAVEGISKISDPQTSQTTDHEAPPATSPERSMRSPDLMRSEALMQVEEVLGS